jgi:hypothetical protein
MSRKRNLSKLESYIVEVLNVILNVMQSGANDPDHIQPFVPKKSDCPKQKRLKNPGTAKQSCNPMIGSKNPRRFSTHQLRPGEDVRCQGGEVLLQRPSSSGNDSFPEENALLAFNIFSIAHAQKCLILITEVRPHAVE